MVTLNCLQSARALALAALVVGLAPVPSFAGTPIVCQRNEEQCDYKCKGPGTGPFAKTQCYSRCQLLHKICLNTPPTAPINSGTSKALPD